MGNISNILFNSPFHLVWIVISLLVVILIIWLAKLREKIMGHMPLITLTTLYSALVVASVIAATKIIRFEIPWLSDWLFPDGIFVPAGVFVCCFFLDYRFNIGSIWQKRSNDGGISWLYLNDDIFTIFVIDG